MLYAAVLTPKGKMIGDLRVLATESELLLDMERFALQAIFDVLRHGLVGYERRDRTSARWSAGCCR